MSSLAQIPESGMKLADVVEFIGEPWNKLVAASRFSKFHAKFWGKSMPGEGEQAWPNLQSADVDVTMGDGDDDADNEVIPGCCELDVDPNPVSDVDMIALIAHPHYDIPKREILSCDLCKQKFATLAKLCAWTTIP